jgi:serine/threonine protein kinase
MLNHDDDITALENSAFLSLAGSMLAAKDLRSEITYELISGTDSEGTVVPLVLGRGRFAKVYKAWQRSAGLNVRPVAIKILHENVERRSEAQLVQEIQLLKSLTASRSVNVINVLDILRLGPMAMCGNCGQNYHPRCPKCGDHLLERHEPPNEAYPALRCPDQARCKYIVSGETILNSCSALFGYPAKTCCAHDKSARAQRGTLINFVDREAVVMEMLGQPLPRFHDYQKVSYARLCRQHGLVLPSPLRELSESLGVQPLPGIRGLHEAKPQEWEFIQKVMLLEKVLLMVQLAESVAWLHGEQQMVHKDIAPDNIMLSFRGESAEADGDWRGYGMAGLGEAITSQATYPSLSCMIIDVGLSDKGALTKAWYEEPVHSLAAEKVSFLSLEARNRRRHINQRIEFDILAHKFVVPDSLRPDKAGEQSLKVGDLLVDESDPNQRYAMEIVAIEQDPHDRRVYRASYAGEAPPNPHVRQFELIHLLGEPHDIYALGAVFYFILTGEYSAVRKMTIIADLLQDAPQPLRAEHLGATIPSFKLCRDQLPEPFYQDDLMVLILRSMVRGLPESFVQSRTDRGPEPARRLLQETRQIYNRLKAEILSSSVLRMLEDVQVAHRALGDNHRMLIRQMEHMSALREQQQLEQSGAMETATRRNRQLLTALVLTGIVALGGWSLTARQIVSDAHEGQARTLTPSTVQSPMQSVDEFARSGS